MTFLKIAPTTSIKVSRSSTAAWCCTNCANALRELMPISCPAGGAGRTCGAYQRHADIRQPEHEFLADEFWDHHAYGKNALTRTASRQRHSQPLPIVQSRNRDVSAHVSSSAACCICEMDFRGARCMLCVHFGLFAKGGATQMHALIEYVQGLVEPEAPLIIAGDFNDGATS